MKLLLRVRRLLLLVIVVVSILTSSVGFAAATTNLTAVKDEAKRNPSQAAFDALYAATDALHYAATDALHYAATMSASHT